MDNETKQILKVIARALMAIAEVSAQRLIVEASSDVEAQEAEEYAYTAIADMRDEEAKL